MTTKPVVTSTPTILDGTVVRWYRSDHAAKYGSETISASRNGVVANGNITPDLFEAAWAVHEQLRRNPRADVSDVVTHRVPFRGQPVAIAAVAGGQHG